MGVVSSGSMSGFSAKFGSLKKVLSIGLGTGVEKHCGQLREVLLYRRHTTQTIAIRDADDGKNASIYR
jgi:hypothetical protein